MKSRPIIFDGESVRAILDGRKTQTRRVVKCHPRTCVITPPEDVFWTAKSLRDSENAYQHLPCPYGQPGDKLWVRETFGFVDSPSTPAHGYLKYRSTNNDKNIKWKPSIHMPKWACRLWLEVVDVRVERLQEISPGDVIREGFTKEGEGEYHGAEEELSALQDLWDRFADRWDSLNAKRGYSWESNPWVWVVEFKEVDDE